jgi:hypothetical protein
MARRWRSEGEFRVSVSKCLEPGSWEGHRRRELHLCCSFFASLQHLLRQNLFEQFVNYGAAFREQAVKRAHTVSN